MCISAIFHNKIHLRYEHFFFLSIAVLFMHLELGFIPTIFVLTETRKFKIPHKPPVDFLLSAYDFFNVILPLMVIAFTFLNGLPILLSLSIVSQISFANILCPYLSISYTLRLIIFLLTKIILASIM